MQQLLFDNHEREIISLRDGSLWYFPAWLSNAKATLYFKVLKRQCQWQQSLIRIAGREVRIPRLNAWYGDPGAHYRYSGTAFQPLSWNRALANLRLRIETTIESENNTVNFNSALANYYRDGNDSVAWHADDEPELGRQPVIASLSLGAKRRFLLKRRDGSESFKLELSDGSLLIMWPPLQHYWLHALPKTKRQVGARINVTFRKIVVQ